MTNSQYRPDIDGIRALAVTIVLLFHARFGLTGGYIGVDVFFVISGYLISTLVVRDLQQGTFRFRDFWLRRVRRLFPALAVMVAGTFAAGLFVLVPEHLNELAESVFVQPFLYANFLFWNQSGYFAPEAEQIPLLHTWSLAVEEQFYLFFPAVAAWMVRRRPVTAAAAAAAVVGLSAAWSVYGTRHFPAAAFFLLPSRIWEFAVGIGLAMLHRFWPGRGQLRGTGNELLSLLGIGLILIPAFFWNSETPFPGLTAAVPCLGTALLIHAHTGRTTRVGRLLSLGPVVFTGRISYSLYLWHWPVLVLTEYVLIDGFTPAARAAALAASCLLAVLSWKYVETPFRRAALLPAPVHLVAAGGLVSAGLAGSAAAVLQMDGLPGRFPSDIYAHRSYEYRIPQFIRHDEVTSASRMPVIGATDADRPPTVLLWGDSHAMSIMPALDDMGRSMGIGIYVAADPGRPPLIGTWPIRKQYFRDEAPVPVVEFVRTRRIEHVILAARWNMYVFGDSGHYQDLLCDETTVSTTPEEAQNVFRRALQRTCRQLRNAGAEIWILRQVPIQPRNTPGTILKLALRQRDLNGLASRVEENRQHFAAINGLLDAAAGERIHFLDPAPCFADDSGRYQVAVEGIAAYVDQDHLSAHGAMQLRPLFRPILAGTTDRSRTAAADRAAARQ